MKKTIIAVLLALALIVVPAASVFAADYADVTVTATPTYISITNNSATGNNYDFGVIAASSHNNTSTGYFTVTNDSTVNINVNIVCDGWHTPPTNHWTYASPAADTAELLASDGGGGYGVTVDDSTPALLHTTSNPGDDFTWELQLEAPTSFSYGDQQTTTVTISASQV
jgi:hypothetical protein